MRSPYTSTREIPKGLGAEHRKEGTIEILPLALTVVELLRREGRTLYVRGVDMLDGTPVLDLSPTFRASRRRSSAAAGWRKPRREASPPPGIESPGA